jgi:hypothetical protein
MSSRRLTTADGAQEALAGLAPAALAAAAATYLASTAAYGWPRHYPGTRSGRAAAKALTAAQTVLRA